MKFLNSILLLILLCPVANTANAENLKVYKLGEIDVLADSVNRMLPLTSQAKHAAIQSKDATTFEELRLLLPSFNLGTNSRGETIFSYRGSRERQINFYLDGALLSVPWDGRADLNMVSPSIIGKLEFIPLTCIYGVNNLMGIAAISTYERTNDGFGGHIRTQIGDGGMKNVEVATEGKIDDFSYTFLVNWLDSDGKIAAKDNDYDFGGYNSALILNSFNSHKNVYLKTVYRPSKIFAVGASANYINYDKGVIPEQHRTSGIRFWQYNGNERLLLTLNSNILTDYAGKNAIKLTYWFDNFTNNIDVFTGIDYKTRNANENGRDFTHGLRIIDVYNFSENNNITFAANALFTEHSERVKNYKDDVLTETTTAEYSQNTFSATVEYNHIFWDLFSFKVGSEFDYWVTPKTGVFTEAEGRNSNALGVIAGVNYSLTRDDILFLNFSRKSRFPSLRESYSAALGKFKVNPDLAPESNILFETGYSSTQIFGNSFLKNSFFKVTGFANFYNDMIVRAFDAETGLEMRDNLESAKIYGVELFAGCVLSRYFRLDANFSYMYSEGSNAGSSVEHLDYQPQFLGGLSLHFAAPKGIKSQLEADFIGKQYVSFSNAYEVLAANCLLNLRLSYDFMIGDGIFVELYLRCNNILDVHRQVRLGIPAAGRTVLSGFLLRI